MLGQVIFCGVYVHDVVSLSTRLKELLEKFATPRSPFYPELSIAIVLKSTRIRGSCNMKLISCYALKTYSAIRGLCCFLDLLIKL